MEVKVYWLEKGTVEVIRKELKEELDSGLIELTGQRETVNIAIFRMENPSTYIWKKSLLSSRRAHLMGLAKKLVKVERQISSLPVD